MLLRDKKLKKQSGVLLSISSLPSKYDIGSLGESAYRFVDFLKSANQKYWQILPVNPLGEGDSPYKSTSCFAGEMLYIDIDFLIRDGLLKADDIQDHTPSDNTDYISAREYKLPLLKKAAENFNTSHPSYIKFTRDNAWWLDDYALFSCALQSFHTDRLCELPDGIKYRVPELLEAFCEKHNKRIEFHKIMQFIFFDQYYSLKKYANRNGISIIGDIPFYVSPDSADVWVNPDNFKVGRDFTPTAVAGVPPDIFSNEGQLWGNPIYNWQNMKRNNFFWWSRRLSMCKALYDVIRIDHFRAFARFYSIPYGAENAKSGTWEKGIGIAFWSAIVKNIGAMNIIAEHLGGEDDVLVKELLQQTGFPDMKIMQFAFTGDMQNEFLPQNYNYNCVAYTGTHDNDTSLSWYENASRREKAVFNSLIKDNQLPVPHRMIRELSKSAAKIIIIPMQDILTLDASARMNTPGTKQGNWQWRMSEEIMNTDNAKLLKNLTRERNK